MSTETPDNTPETGLFHGWGAKLKDMLVETDLKPQRAGSKPAAVGVAAEPGLAAPVVGSAPRAAQGANPMIASLMTMVLGRATAYTALLEQIAPLEAFIPDEANRFKAAFAVVGKTRTIEQIAQSIDMQHIQALDAEVQRFNGQSRGKEEQEVTSRQQEIATLTGAVSSANAEAIRVREQADARLLELAAAVQRNSGRITSMEQEVAEKRAAIARVHQQFEDATAIVREQLVQAKTKVLRYLAT